MKDLRTNKTELYIIIENSCCDGCEEIQTFIFDDEETAHEKFEQLVADDKAFLEEEETTRVRTLDSGRRFCACFAIYAAPFAAGSRRPFFKVPVI